MNTTKSTKRPRRWVTITLSESAIDALTVLTLVDMRSKSMEIEYLIFDAIERRNIEQHKAAQILAQSKPNDNQEVEI